MFFKKRTYSVESSPGTPGSRALDIMENVHKEFVFKKPSGVPRKRRRVNVLDEETYVEDIGNIIQRDFFPHLEKIKAQNDYLDAKERNDTARLRELYMKYSGKKPSIERIPSPATFETPANIHHSQDDVPILNKDSDIKKDSETVTMRSMKLSLDQYLNSHTSQDNKSFEEILEVNEKQHREKYKFLYGAEDDSKDNKVKLLALPSIQQQAALAEKPFNVDTWGYKNRNYLMYNPDGVQLSSEEELEFFKNKQGIVHENTSLKLNPFNEIRSKETINELAKTQAKVLDGKIGVDGKELLKPETPQVGGFSFVRTPSPSPSMLGSPLMTWGEIEGTPFMLDGSDTPLPNRSQGQSFKMAEPPRREQLALALAEKVGEKNRDQKQRALDAQRRQFSSPSPRPNTSTIDRLATMSPAARKLATSHLKLTPSNILRSSYSPSPRGTKSPYMKLVSRTITTPNTTTTPKRVMTPKRATTPKIDLGIKKADPKVSTDDLLNISLPSRKKAADFF